MNTLQQPLVSVLTPVYNMGEYLAECIESILAQNYRNFEYIIVNNCSTDQTLEVATKYAKQDSRIRVHNNDALVPVIENHNIAFNLMSSAAKYCKLVCADDFIFPDCLAQMVKVAEANPSIGLVGSYSLAGKRVMWDGLEYERSVVNGREISRATLLGGPYVFGSPTSLLYRADLIRMTKAFFPNPSPHADTTACYQSLEGSDFGFVHQVLSYTRIHSESETSRSVANGKINLALIGDLTRFGPKHLSPVELERRLADLMDTYYRVLVNILFSQSWDREFWRRQRSELRAIGLRFSSAALLKTGVKMMFGLLLKPRVVMKRISRAKRNGAKVEAAYYGTQT
jgi:glycosyltransferase involved in cell wall biosynthesis